MSPSVVALICMSVVMCVMTLLVGVLYALQAVSRRQAKSAAAVPEDGITPELVVVLAAAAHAALGKAVVVRRIHVLRPAGQENWSRVGRIDILRSHRMEPKR
ncbi:MAG: OadG family protein [Holophagales bacterium]|nr:OadG family protein [Holophagales bacterium]